MNPAYQSGLLYVGFSLSDQIRKGRNRNTGIGYYSSAAGPGSQSGPVDVVSGFPQPIPFFRFTSPLEFRAAVIFRDLSYTAR